MGEGGQKYARHRRQPVACEHRNIPVAGTPAEGIRAEQVLLRSDHIPVAGTPAEGIRAEQVLLRSDLFFP